MEFSEVLRDIVEKHVQKHGIASVWAVPGVYEALAADPAWSNEVCIILDNADTYAEIREDEELI